MDDSFPPLEHLPFRRMGECQKCGGDGVFHITEIVDGVTRVLWLCLECAGEHLRQSDGDQTGE